MIKTGNPIRLVEAPFLFLLFGVIGWMYEVVLAFLYGYGFVNRGFLTGPYLPLYGFGALLLIICLDRIKRSPLRIGNVVVTPIVVFVLIVLLTTAVEYAVGFGLEVVFQQRWWDYSTYKYQLHGRICLSASIRFGLGGMVFLYLLAPLFSRWVESIPPRARRVLALLVVALILLDLAFTLAYASVNGFNPVLAQAR